MNGEPKPCPFCGVSLIEEDYGEGVFWIHRAGNSCVVDGEVYRRDELPAWNRRAEPAAAEAEAELLANTAIGIAAGTADKVMVLRARVEELEERVTVVENPPILTATVALHSLDIDRLKARLTALERVAGYGQRAEEG